MTFASCKQTLHGYSQDAKVVNENFIMCNGGRIILQWQQALLYEICSGPKAKTDKCFGGLADAVDLIVFGLPTQSRWVFSRPDLVTFGKEP